MTHDDSTRPSLEVGRRGLIKAGSIGALGLGLAGMTLHEAHAAPAAAGKSSGPVTGIATKARLAFRPDSKFKTIQFNDTQDGARTDRRTVEFMEKAIAAEKPDLVVLVGDQLTSDAQTVLQQKQALNNVIQPMERAGVAWAATFGNHDEDPTSTTGMDEPAMLGFFRTYERNVNTAGVQGITGTGNMNLLIGDSRDGEPMFGVWLLDSGRYTPKEIAGQDFEGYPRLGLAARRPDPLVPGRIRVRTAPRRRQGAVAHVHPHRAVGAPLHVVRERRLAQARGPRACAQEALHRG